MTLLCSRLIQSPWLATIERTRTWKSGKDGSMTRHRTLVTYLTAYLFATGTVIRYLVQYYGDALFWWVTGLLPSSLPCWPLSPGSLDGLASTRISIWLYRPASPLGCRSFRQNGTISPLYSHLLPCKLYTFSSPELAFVG